MISFKRFALREAEEKKSAAIGASKLDRESPDEEVSAEVELEVVIDDILMKIGNCKTLEGLEELRSYCDKRMSEVNISKSSEIAIYDALDGRQCELETAEREAEEAEQEKKEAKAKAAADGAQADKF